MTYVRLPQAMPVKLPRLTVNGKRRCAKCLRWLAPYEFESKGRRNGRQRRRGTCIACRSFTALAFKPLLDDGTERKCKVCGKWKPLTKFYRIEGVYRLRTCAHCCRKGQRMDYRRMRRNAGRSYTARPWLWKQEGE